MSKRRFSTRTGLLAGLLILVIAVNVVAYMHARAMVTFSESGARTRGPENLSWATKIRVLFSGVTLPRPVNARTPADLGLAYETAAVESPNGTLEVWFVDVPEPRATVVALHGYGEAKEQLLEVAGPLAEMDLNLVLVDFYGSGGSSGNATSIGYREALDVAAAVAAARERHPDAPVVVYGISMGAAAALRAVHAHDLRVDALILEGPFDTLLNTAKNRFRMMQVPSTPFAHLLLFWGGVHSGYNAFQYRPVDYAASVTCPTLILHGAKDRRVPVEQVRAVHEALLSERRRLSLYKDAKHELMVNVNPQRWRRDVEAILDAI